MSLMTLMTLMLKLIVALLLLANATFFVWSQGFLRAWDFAPKQQTEPERVAQQINPDAIRLLKPDEARRLDVAATVVAKPLECLQAGVFDDIQATVLRKSLEASLPVGSWVLEPMREAPRWIVYMGKYPNADALAKKRSELAALNLKLEALTNPSLELGFSLGSFETQTAATNALNTLTKRGVRTARVVQERAELRGTNLKLNAVDDALRGRLDEMKAALAGKALRACK